MIDFWVARVGISGVVKDFYVARDGSGGVVKAFACDTLLRWIGSIPVRFGPLTFMEIFYSSSELLLALSFGRVILYFLSKVYEI